MSAVLAFEACATGDEVKPGSGGAGGSSGDDAGNLDAGATGGAGGSGGTDASGGTGGVDPTLCGNVVVDEGEECDDGNTASGDGCEPSCVFTCIPGAGGDAVCNDHLPCNGAEVCLPEHTCSAGTALPSGTSCGDNKSCLNGACVDTVEVCGDGLFVSTSEECDDGNLTSGDGCELDCLKTCVSTDQRRDCKSPCMFGAACDDNTSKCLVGTPVPDGLPCGTNLACRGGTCSGVFCGDGAVSTNEECDDANLTAADGCENDCRFSCVATDASRDCTRPDPCQGTSTCSASTHTCSVATPLAEGTPCGLTSEGRLCIGGACTRPVCNNGVLEPTEQCDDGNLVDSDGCKVDCTYTCTQASECSDARICTQDVCDTSTHTCANPPDTSVNGRACSEGGVTNGTCQDGACTPPACGNGSIDSGEVCDLGAQNGQAGSGCTSACQYECSSDAACSDGEPCNGTETCVPVTGGHTCQNGTPSATGSVCNSSPRAICLSQTCQVSACGDGYVDSGATPAEECEPPSTQTCSASCQNIPLCDLNGTWAIKITATISWNASAALSAGSGTVTSWLLVTRTQSGATVTDISRPCGLLMPDFQGNAGGGGETYGMTFPNAIFDNNALQTATSTGTLSPGPSPGAAFSSTVMGTIIGIYLSNPTKAWPPAGAAQHVDDDNDGKPGITVPSKTGSPYSLFPLDASKTARATDLYFAARQVTTFGGTLTSCTEQSGAAVISRQDTLVLGCRSTTGGDCTPTQRDFLNTLKPTYNMPVNATYTMVKIAGGSSCATVRSTLP